MATIKLCDWTKKRLGKDEETFVVVVGDQEFEVGEEGRDALLKQLEGDDAPDVPQVVERVVEASQAPMQPAPAPVQIEAPSEPFDQGPGSMPAAPQAEAEEAQPRQQDGEMLEIPEDTRRPLKKPSASLAKRIVEEATIFDEGSLPSLTMGASQQREALRKLKELEEAQNDKLRRRTGKGIRINFDNEYGGPR